MIFTKSEDTQETFILSGHRRIPAWNGTGRPKQAKAGTFGFNFQTNNLEYWDGNSWFAASMKEK